MGRPLRGPPVPDVTLPRLAGGEINPAHLRGQKLALFLCPADPEAAVREIEAYRALADGFHRAGVWLLGVVSDRLPESGPADRKGPHICIARDSGGWVRSHLMAALPRPAEGRVPDPSGGAAFLFERWGELDKAWASAGHAEDVLRAAAVASTNGSPRPQPQAQHDEAMTPAAT